MIQQDQQDQVITYHMVTLGALTREGDAQTEITIQNAEGESQTLPLRVPAGLPGERVTIAYEPPPAPRSRRRKRHWKPRPPRVWITEIHTASPLRIQAPCSVFGVCGGCQLQHIHYEAELILKCTKVEQLVIYYGAF